MSVRYETLTVPLIGILCHCFDVRQRASADRDIRFTVRVHRVRANDLDRGRTWLRKAFYRAWMKC
jgi:hypothetical protein